MISYTLQVVDQSWQRPNDPPSDAGWWALPLVILVLIGLMLVIERRPWVLLGLALILVLVIPLFSFIFK